MLYFPKYLWDEFNPDTINNPCSLHSERHLVLKTWLTFVCRSRKNWWLLDLSVHVVCELTLLRPGPGSGMVPVHSSTSEQPLHTGVLDGYKAMRCYHPLLVAMNRQCCFIHSFPALYFMLLYSFLDDFYKCPLFPIMLKEGVQTDTCPWISEKIIGQDGNGNSPQEMEIVFISRTILFSVA